MAKKTTAKQTAQQTSVSAVETTTVESVSQFAVENGDYDYPENGDQENGDQQDEGNSAHVESLNAKKKRSKTMTLTTGKLPETTIGKIPERIAEAILARNVGHVIEQVTISARVSGTGKDHKQDFDAYYALDGAGIEILSNGKIVPATAKADLPKGVSEKQSEELTRKGACDYFNYGRLLDIRAAVRSKLEDSIMGLEKAIDKQVKTMMEGDLYDTVEEAREHVIRRWKKQVMEDGNTRLPADYVYPVPAETTA